MRNSDQSQNKSNINVKVIPEYLAKQSEPENDRYAFAYHITITNNSDQDVVLLHRHWIIVDANQQRQEVKGAGVIGQQPLIPKDTNYQYSSGVILKTAVGTMQGSYQMEDEQGLPLEATIAPFLLAKPNAVH